MSTRRSTGSNSDPYRASHRRDVLLARLRHYRPQACCRVRYAVADRRSSESLPASVQSRCVPFNASPLARWTKPTAVWETALRRALLHGYHNEESPDAMPSAGAQRRSRPWAAHVSRPQRQGSTQLVGGRPHRCAPRCDALPGARVWTEMPISVPGLVACGRPLAVRVRSAARASNLYPRHDILPRILIYEDAWRLLLLCAHR